MPHICQLYVWEAIVQSSQIQNCSYVYLPQVVQLLWQTVCVCVCVFTAILRLLSSLAFQT